MLLNILNVAYITALTVIVVVIYLKYKKLQNAYDSYSSPCPDYPQCKCKECETCLPCEKCPSITPCPTGGVRFSCKQGRGEDNDKVLEKGTSRSTIEECQQLCKSNDSCLGFDFSENDISNKCRLFGSNIPKHTGGPENRQYCMKIKD